jgi:PAS domain S-box-containing protein
MGADGSGRAVRLDSVPLVQGGRLTGVYSAILDISVQKRAEDERKRLVLIVEHAAEMILMTDRDGVVQYANNAFLQSSGKKRGEVIGVPVRDCAGAEDADFYERLHARLQRERKWNGRMTLKGPDGRFSELDVAVSPMRDASGLLLNYVIVCRDVTTEAILARQLRQVQKMEAIQTLAGGIAHDFNNLLAAIMGNVELAMDDLAADSSVRHNLEQIFKASRRAKDLVKQILLFSRRDQQESVLVEAGPLVTETMKLLRSSIPGAIDIRHRVEPGRSTVLADAGRLQQILMNLVSNAVHAMREKGGALDVLVGECQLTADDASPPGLSPGPYLKIGVSDNGHGMPQGVVERIFEPFFTTKRPGEGPGMGLAVVHGLVKALKGAITVSSELGAGSTFTVYLPIATSETERTVKEESRPLPRGAERILFVDDEKPIIEMNSALLEPLGYHVTAVASSAKALELFTAAPDAFDLVITDEAMPDLTGIELVERIRSLRKNIPIIMITGFSETIDAERAKKMGIREFLMKPLARRELAEAIRNVLDGRK